jgi:hypothetical protein
MDRSPEQWRDLLLPRLEARRPRHAVLRDYYDGTQPLPTAPSTSTDIYRRLARLAETNMCGLVVDTVNERLRPKGVRLTESGTADLDVWRRIWQANNLDADWPVAQEEALKVGRGPVLVWPDGGVVSVTVEDPDEVIVAYAPGSSRVREAALKCYIDDEYEYVTVWTPFEQRSWVRDAPKATQLRTSGDGAVLHIPTTIGSNLSGGVWEDDPENSGTNPLGAVPVVELLSKPSVKGIPKPELSNALLRLQDRLNKTLFDTVVAAEFGAFPQRYAIGIQVETGANGRPVNPLTIGPNRTWVLDQSDGQTGSIGQLDPFPLDQLLGLSDVTIKHIASITQTPVYYLLSGLTNVGADSIRAAETGHVAKIMGHQTQFGEAAEEMFRLALRAEGDGGEYPDIEMEWAPPETRSPAELADAVIKLSQAGWPFEAVLRYMGETPSSIARITAERDAETPPVPAEVPQGRDGPPTPVMG